MWWRLFIEEYRDEPTLNWVKMFYNKETFTQKLLLQADLEHMGWCHSGEQPIKCSQLQFAWNKKHLKWRACLGRCGVSRKKNYRKTKIQLNKRKVSSRVVIHNLWKHWIFYLRFFAKVSSVANREKVGAPGVSGHFEKLVQQVEVLKWFNQEDLLEFSKTQMTASK